MAWIESHQALGRHPKTVKLADALGVDIVKAVGFLHFLWWWALDYAPDGIVKAENQAAAARACMWPKKWQIFWGALLTAGFVEASSQTENEFIIHDWMDYAGRLLERRKADAERKRLRRTSAGRPVQPGADVRRTVPNRTQPDRTGPDHPPLVPPTGDNGRPADRFTCCALADVTQGKDHMQSCPTMAVGE